MTRDVCACAAPSAKPPPLHPGTPPHFPSPYPPTHTSCRRPRAICLLSWRQAGRAAEAGAARAAETPTWTLERMSTSTGSKFSPTSMVDDPPPPHSPSSLQRPVGWASTSYPSPPLPGEFQGLPCSPGSLPVSSSSPPLRSRDKDWETHLSQKAVKSSVSRRRNSVDVRRGGGGSP